MVKTQMVIFDFDGTVIDSLDEELRIFNEIASKSGYTLIDSSNKETLRAKSLRAVISEVGIPMYRVPFLLMRGRREIAKSLVSLKPFAGIRGMLRELSRKYKVGLATSNSLSNVQKFCRLHDISEFQYIEAGIGLFGKARKLRRLLNRANIAPRDAIYVGDELRDIEAAHTIGTRSIFVTWGANTKSALGGLSPDAIAETPEEIIRILAQ